MCQQQYSNFFAIMIFQTFMFIFLLNGESINSFLSSKHKLLIVMLILGLFSSYYGDFWDGVLVFLWSAGSYIYLALKLFAMLALECRVWESLYESIQILYLISYSPFRFLIFLYAYFKMLKSFILNKHEEKVSKHG